MRPEMYPPTPPTTAPSVNGQSAAPAPAGKRYARAFQISSIVTYSLIALLFATPFILNYLLPSNGSMFGNLILIVLTMLVILVVDIIAGIVMIVTGIQYIRHDNPVGRALVGAVISISVYSLFILFIATTIAMNIMRANM